MSKFELKFAQSRKLQSSTPTANVLLVILVEARITTYRQTSLQTLNSQLLKFKIYFLDFFLSWNQSWLFKQNVAIIVTFICPNRQNLLSIRSFICFKKIQTAPTRWIQGMKMSNYVTKSLIFVLITTHFIFQGPECNINNI